LRGPPGDSFDHAYEAGVGMDVSPPTSLLSGKNHFEHGKMIVYRNCNLFPNFSISNLLFLMKFVELFFSIMG